MTLLLNWYSVFYWLTVADNSRTLFGIFAGFGLLVAVILAAIRGATQDEGYWKKDDSKLDRRWFYRFWYTTIIVCLLGWSGCVFVPSKTDAMVIIAGGSIGNFMSNDSSSKAIPAELTRFVRGYLKKNADEMNLDVDTKQSLGVATPRETTLDKLKNFSKEQIIEYLQKDTTVIK